MLEQESHPETYSLHVNVKMNCQHVAVSSMIRFISLEGQRTMVSLRAVFSFWNRQTDKRASHTHSYIQEILQHFPCHLGSNLNLGNHHIAELLNTNELIITFDNKTKCLESGLIFRPYSLRKTPWYSGILKKNHTHTIISHW